MSLFDYFRDPQEKTNLHRLVAKERLQISSSPMEAWPAFAADYCRSLQQEIIDVTQVRGKIGNRDQGSCCPGQPG